MARRLSIGFIFTFLLVAGLGLPTQRILAYGPVVSTCDYASLSTAISSANAGDIITFTCNGTITWGATISITKPLTLDGTGHTIILDGANAHQLFIVSAGTFGITN